MALEQVEILFDEAVPPDSIVVGHLGDKRDVDYYAEIAGTGVYIQFDHIGKQRYLPDSVRANMVKELIDYGFGAQILLSLDSTYKTELKQYGGIGFDYIQTHFVPRLQKCGVSEDEIHALLVENPRGVLSSHTEPWQSD